MESGKTHLMRSFHDAGFGWETLEFLEAGEAVICASGQSASGRLGSSSSAGGQQAVAQVWLAGLLACSLPACRPKIRAGDWLPFMGIFPKLPNAANWLVSSLTDPH